MDRFTQFAMCAAVEAMAQAGLEPDTATPERFGVILGNGIGGIETLESQFKRVAEKGIKSMHPLFVPMMISNEAAGNVAIRFHAFGPCSVVVTACASSNDALGQAWRLIRDGEMDVMLAGGTEAPLTPLGLGGFCQLQAVSTRNDDPSHASRPFDKDRDGFVMSEGSGVLVLEEMEHAKKRGATILAEMGGYGATCDANHLTAPHPQGRGAIRALQIALETAGLTPTDIDYVNAHGTSTPINDPIETMAIKAVFGDHARKLKVSSTKSMTGHLLGAARRGGHRVHQGHPRPVLPGRPAPGLPRPRVRPGLRAQQGIPGQDPRRGVQCPGFGGHNSVVFSGRTRRRTGEVAPQQEESRDLPGYGTFRSTAVTAPPMVFRSVSIRSWIPSRTCSAPLLKSLS